MLFVFSLRDEVCDTDSAVVSVCMFHTDYIIGEYFFPFELVHLKVDTSRSIDIFLMSVRQRYIQSFALKLTDRDGRKRILFAFIILQKRILWLLWVHTNKRRVFTDLKDVLLLSLWAKMEYIRSKWAHRRLHLSYSERTALHTSHRYCAHFSRLTLDWADM